MRNAAVLALASWMCTGCAGNEAKISSQRPERSAAGADSAVGQSNGTDQPTHVADADHAADGNTSDGSAAGGSSHVCTRACKDHYFDGEQLVTVEGHEHGPSCGHAWDGKHWVEVVPSSPHGGHMCTEKCADHFREGDLLTSIYNHKHGPGCGHLWDGLDWLRVVKTGDD